MFQQIMYLFNFFTVKFFHLIYEKAVYQWLETNI